MVPLLAAAPIFDVQEERRHQAELKRQREEEATREYRKKLRFSVSVTVVLFPASRAACSVLAGVVWRTCAH